MSRGLGQVQRTMLFTLAEHEVRLAELARQQQRPYRSPDRWSLTGLIRTAFWPKFEAKQRAQHDRWQETLRRWKAGDPDATEAVKFEVNRYSMFRQRAPIDLTEFEPERPKDHELQRFNPSRAVLSLELHGFVLRDRYCRHSNLALTCKGFAEAKGRN